MLKDITIGQYYPSGSFIHRLDPRVKLAGTILFIISLFPFSTIPVYVLVTAYLVMLIALCRVPLTYILKGLRPVLFLIILTGVLNLLTVRGGNEVFSYWKIVITDNGIYRAVFMVLRILYLVIGSSLMTYTTTPKELTDGIEKALNPLKRVRVPVHEFALIMSLALRFIPILIEEAERIMNAQTSRGGNIEEGSFISRAKGIVSILVPLLISAIKRANDLAYAMEARCYNGGSGRTKLHPLRYRSADILCYVAVLFYLAVIAVGILIK